MGNLKRNFWGQKYKYYFSDIWAFLAERAEAKNSKKVL